MYSKKVKLTKKEKENRKKYFEEIDLLKPLYYTIQTLQKNYDDILEKLSQKYLNKEKEKNI